MIILCGKVPITQDTTWSMADLPNGKVVRNTGLTTYLIDVQNEATLTLDHIIIDGGGGMFPALKTGSACGTILYLESGTELVLNRGPWCKTVSTALPQPPFTPIPTARLRSMTAYGS